MAAAMPLTRFSGHCELAGRRSSPCACCVAAGGRLLQHPRTLAPALALPLRLRQPAAVQRRQARRVSTAAAASLAQPALRAAGRLAARAFGTSFLLNLVRGARGAITGRAGPFLFAGLVAYSVAVTLYAAQASSRASSLAGTSVASTASEFGSEPSQQPEPAAPESFAAAVAATAVVAPPAPSGELERRLQQARQQAEAAAKREERVTCKVCGGSGVVSYENHMTQEEGTICPCCLVRGWLLEGS